MSFFKYVGQLWDAGGARLTGLGLPTASNDAARLQDLPQGLAQGAAAPSGLRGNTLLARQGAPAYLDLSQSGTTPPNAPGTGLLREYVKSYANRRLPAVTDEWGHDVALQEHFGRNKVGYWYPLPGGNTASSPGMTMATAVGTATARTWAATNSLTRVSRIGYVSASGTAGSMCELRSGVAFNTAGNGNSNGNAGFFLIMRFAPSDAAAVSGEKFFAGMKDTPGTAATNVEPTALTGAVGVGQISTDATQFYYIGAGTSAQAGIPCGTAVGAPTSTTNIYELTIWAPPGLTNVYYMQLINTTTGVAAAIVTINGSTAALAPQNGSGPLAWRIWKTNGSATAAVSFDVVSVYLSTDT